MKNLKTKIFLTLAVVLPINANALTGQEVSNTCGLATECGSLIANISTSSGNITPSADNTYDVGTSSFGFRSGYFDTSVLTPLLIPSASLVIRVDADAQRLFTFDASSDTALTTVFGDSGTTAAQVWTQSAGTSDADDDGTICITGGGTCGNNARGGYVSLQGADVGGTGLGFTSIGGTGRIDFFTGTGGTNALRLADTGNATFSGTIVSDGTNTIGWSVVAGANTACTTTCTAACVFGVNTAATEADIVACSDATADECLCAGAS